METPERLLPQEAGRAETPSEKTNHKISATAFATEFAAHAALYMELLQFGNQMKDIDFQTIFEEAVKLVFSGRIEEIKEPQGPLFRHPFFLAVCRKVEEIFLRRMKECCLRGDYLSALKFLILVSETHRLTRSTLHLDATRCYFALASNKSHDPVFLKLFEMARKTFPHGVTLPHRSGVACNNGFSEPNPSQRPLSPRAPALAYERVNPEELDNYSIRQLRDFATQASLRRDCQKELAFRQKIVKFTKVETDDYKKLAELYMFLKRQDDAREILEALVELGKTGKLDEVLPATYVDVTAKIFPLCTIAKLIAYSIQAQGDRDWGMIIFFQEEIVARQPTAMSVVLLANAYENEGYERQEWEARMKAAGMSDYKPRGNHNEERLRILGRKFSGGLEKKAAPAEPARPHYADELHTFRATAGGRIGRLLEEAAAKRSNGEQAAAAGERQQFSSFDDFIGALLREMKKWPGAGEGDAWHDVPPEMRENILGNLHRFEAAFTQGDRVSQSAHPQFWEIFYRMKKSMEGESPMLNIYELRKFQELMQGMEGVSWNI